jgi:hypothetical protein
MGFYKLRPKVGNHSETDKDGNVKTYNAKDGHVFKSKADLCKMFPLKFERVHSFDPDEEEGMGAEIDMGKEVTENFPNATEAEFRIFLNDKKYYVVEEDSPKTPLNSKPLRKSGVEKFIKKYLSE